MSIENVKQLYNITDRDIEEFDRKKSPNNLKDYNKYLIILSKKIANKFKHQKQNISQ